MRIPPSTLTKVVVTNKARLEVYSAIRSGRLPSLSAGNIPCTDCGSAAQVYEHRDYRRSLDVEPVCRPCNARRGEGEPFRSNPKWRPDDEISSP